MPTAKNKTALAQLGLSSIFSSSSPKEGECNVVTVTRSVASEGVPAAAVHSTLSSTSTHSMAMAAVDVSREGKTKNPGPAIEDGAVEDEQNHGGKDHLVAQERSSGNENEDETMVFLAQAIAAADETSVKKSAARKRGLPEDIAPSSPYYELTSAIPQEPDGAESVIEKARREYRLLHPEVSSAQRNVVNTAGTVKWKRKTFEDRMMDIIEFKAANGHCNVPVSYKKDPSLGDWCRTQRKVYGYVKDGFKKTTPERESQFRQLEQVGFKW
eukprot:CAMPEP_0197238350 /NCGR_PEP_ID=MMETSP1429-20130617/4840_1 /TAXON_ID=49237 /ORGANISM="Chaetoceros  sp., Strain UNC1202" /LENGTH=269 /DNA_ID=CAMNT_0042697477 /DNA_START=17 /DNA_END=823 /DNA_ORIENTATION=+